MRLIDADLLHGEHLIEQMPDVRTVHGGSQHARRPVRQDRRLQARGLQPGERPGHFGEHLELEVKVHEPVAQRPVVDT